MTFLVYLAVLYILAIVCKKHDINLPDENTLIILAILTAGEVVSWSRKK